MDREPVMTYLSIFVLRGRGGGGGFAVHRPTVMDNFLFFAANCLIADNVTNCAECLPMIPICITSIIYFQHNYYF